MKKIISLFFLIGISLFVLGCRIKSFHEPAAKLFISKKSDSMLSVSVYSGGSKIRGYYLNKDIQLKQGTEHYWFFENEEGKKIQIIGETIIIEEQ
jgi:hypothetical protein